MKRIFKICLMCMILVFFTTGCVKMKYDMKINANKKIDFSVISAISDEIKNQGENSSEFGYSIEDIEKFKKNGVTVNDYKEDGYTGYKLEKHFKNIDEVSNQENVSNKIDDFFDEKAQGNYFFKIDKGFLKNKYKATFDISDMNTDISGFDFENLESNDVLENEDIIDTDNTTTNTEDNNLLNDMDFSNMMKGMEAKFVVRLPYKSLSNNASHVSEDGKTLTWDFITNQNLKTIEFEFEIWDQKIIYIGIFLILLIIIAIIAAIINRPKKVVTSEEQFQKQLNTSTMDEPEEIDDVLGTNMVNK